MKLHDSVQNAISILALALREDKESQYVAKDAEGFVKRMTQESGETFPQPGLYEHFKGGKYHVLFHARNSANPDETIVVYRALRENGAVWIRKQSEFLEIVDWKDGTRGTRFRPLTNACSECGGSLGGHEIGRLERHAGWCPRFPL